MTPPSPAARRDQDVTPDLLRAVLAGAGGRTWLCSTAHGLRLLTPDEAGSEVLAGRAAPVTSRAALHEDGLRLDSAHRFARGSLARAQRVCAELNRPLGEAAGA